MKTNNENLQYLLPSKKTQIIIEDMFTPEMKTILIDDLFNPVNLVQLKIDKNKQNGFDWTDENKINECKKFFEKLFPEDVDKK